MNPGIARLADRMWFGPAGHLVRSAIADTAVSLLPSECAGCRCDAGPLCQDCVVILGRALAQPRVVDDLRELDVLAPPEPAPVVAAGTYSGVVSTVILSAKNRGGLGLIARLAPALLRSWATLERHVPAGPVAAVPIPSQANSVRTRGFAPVDELIKSSGLGKKKFRYSRDERNGGPHAKSGGYERGARAHISRSIVILEALKVHPLVSLGLSGRTAAQKTRGQRGRAAAIKGKFVINRRGLRRRQIPRRVVLVDDVMTTGATLAEAARVLRSCGFEVVGAVCLAWVRPPDHQHPARETVAPLGASESA